MTGRCHGGHVLVHQLQILSHTLFHDLWRCSAWLVGPGVPWCSLQHILLFFIHKNLLVIWHLNIFFDDFPSWVAAWVGLFENPIDLLKLFELAIVVFRLSYDALGVWIWIGSCVVSPLHNPLFLSGTTFQGKSTHVMRIAKYVVLLSILFVSEFWWGLAKATLLIKLNHLIVLLSHRHIWMMIVLCKVSR